MGTLTSFGSFLKCGGTKYNVLKQTRHRNYVCVGGGGGALATLVATPMPLVLYALQVNM